MLRTIYSGTHCLRRLDQANESNKPLLEVPLDRQLTTVTVTVILNLFCLHLVAIWVKPSGVSFAAVFGYVYASYQLYNTVWSIGY